MPPRIVRWLAPLPALLLTAMALPAGDSPSGPAAAEDRSAGKASAGKPSAESLGSLLPDAPTLLRLRAGLQLDAGQIADIERVWRDGMQRHGALMDAVHAAERDFAAILAGQASDESRTTAAGNRLIDAEREVKLLRLRTLVDLQRRLTPAQRQALPVALSAERKALVAAVEEVRILGQRAHALGLDVNGLPERLRGIERSLHEGAIGRVADEIEAVRRDLRGRLGITAGGTP